MQIKSIIFTLLLYISSFCFSNAAEKNFINELKDGGKLILIRHSNNYLPVSTDATSLAEAPATNGIHGDVSFDPPRNVCILRGLILS